MWYPKQDSTDASVFLIAAWHELFYACTPDSYQPRLHNVASLIRELRDVASRWVDEPRYKTHIEKIQSELKVALREENDFLTEMPEFQSRAERIIKETAPTQILLQCDILTDFRELYEKNLLSYARKAIIDGLPDKKHKAHAAIRQIATLGFQHGKEDDDVWCPFSKDERRNISDIFDEIVSLTLSKQSEYRCTFAMVGESSEIQSLGRKIGFDPQSKSELPREFIEESSKQGETLLLQASVSAHSIRQAVTESRRRLGIANGLVSLYHNDHRIRVHPTVMIKRGVGYVRFSQTEQAFRRLHPRKMANRDILDGLSRLLDSQSIVDRRLLGAIELLSLAAGAADPRVRLINLWSSIETLCGGHEGNTTLERVCALIVPLVTCRHVSRTMRFLAIECQRFGEHINSSDYGPGFPKSWSKYVSPDEMLKTTASPEGSPPITSLLKFCDHTFLRYRVFKTWQTVHSPEELSKTLKKSKERLEWHLARIYRARNHLVHQGEESPYLVPLVDNLQNYLSMVVQRLIHVMKQNPTWDVRHAIEYWSGKLEFILNSLANRPGCLTTQDFIEGQTADRIWTGS